MGDRISNNKRNVKVPVQPGFSQMHWMLKTKKPGADLTAGFHSQSCPPVLTMDEVAKHSSEQDAWTVFEGRVYNLTPYFQFHPGGKSTLMEIAGCDCTHLFHETHAWVNGHGMLEKCLLGDLVEVSQSPDPNVINIHNWTSQVIREIERMASTTSTIKTFTFDLPELECFEPGQYLRIRAKIGNDWIERAYTPVPLGRGFQLLIKLYSHGKMSRYLDQLCVGQEIEMLLGPQTRWRYNARLHELRLSPASSMTVGIKTLVMISAGSGITPMLNLLFHLFRPADEHTTKPRMILIDCNHTIEDIMGKKTLMTFAQQVPPVEIHHVLSAAPSAAGALPDDRYPGEMDVFESVTYQMKLNRDFLTTHVPVPSRHMCIVSCGPASFGRDLSRYLDTSGYSSSHGVHRFEF